MTKRAQPRSRAKNCPCAQMDHSVGGRSPHEALLNKPTESWSSRRHWHQAGSLEVPRQNGEFRSRDSLIRGHQAIVLAVDSCAYLREQDISVSTEVRVSSGLLSVETPTTGSGWPGRKVVRLAEFEVRRRDPSPSNHATNSPSFRRLLNCRIQSGAVTEVEYVDGTFVALAGTHRHEDDWLVG